MDFGLLTTNGIKPLDAILTATRNAADLLGASDRVGSIQVGRYADLIAAEGDLLIDLGQLAHVTFVMEGGIVYQTNGKPVAD